jgi:RNA polymerase sigma-70 factor (ECF subfamily)
MMDLQDSEADLIEAAQQGDHQAFARLVETYKQPVYNLAYRMLGSAAEAEDASQEVFLRSYMKLASYDRSRKFSTWLLAIASNYCIDVLRRRRATMVDLDDVEFVLETPEPGPEHRAVAREEQTSIAEAIEALAPAYRLVTVLRYYNDLPYDEIERITGLNETTIKTRLFRARKMIKERLVEQGVTPWNVETSAR